MIVELRIGVDGEPFEKSEVESFESPFAVGISEAGGARRPLDSPGGEQQLLVVPLLSPLFFPNLTRLFCHSLRCFAPLR